MIKSRRLEMLGLGPKIAIFTTSDIWKYAPPGNPMERVSTGKLEAAIEQGYKVLVASTRTELGDCDQWWLKLVGIENVFMADETLNTGDDESMQEYFNSGWKRLFKRLGVKWPMKAHTYGKEMHWNAARYELYKYPGIKNGSTF